MSPGWAIETEPLPPSLIMSIFKRPFFNPYESKKKRGMPKGLWIKCRSCLESASIGECYASDGDSIARGSASNH